MIPPPDHTRTNPRFEFRLRQVQLTALTVMLTAWCFTLGPIPAIIAVLVAKHILVAILVAGIDRERDEADSHHDPGDDATVSSDY